MRAGRAPLPPRARRVGTRRFNEPGRGAEGFKGGDPIDACGYTVASCLMSFFSNVAAARSLPAGTVPASSSRQLLGPASPAAMPLARRVAAG
jgi:hypothetical protein